MTKLRHDSPPRESDPGAVVSVPDVTRPYTAMTPQQAEARRIELAEAAKKQRELTALRGEYERAKDRVRPLRKKRAGGGKLKPWENSVLDRWLEIRKLLGL